MKVKKLCAFCNKEFIARVFKSMPFSRSRACSRICASSMRRKYPDRNCLFCKRIFRPDSGNALKGQGFLCSRECQRLNHVGHIHSSETKKQMQVSAKIAGTGLWNRNRNLFGSNNPNWKNGATHLSQVIRSLPKYRRWRESIFKRDKFTCLTCGVIGGTLNVHHLTSFTSILRTYSIKTTQDAINCPKLWDTTNGSTLCLNCHKKTDTYGGGSNEVVKEL